MQLKKKINSHVLTLQLLLLCTFSFLGLVYLGSTYQREQKCHAWDGFGNNECLGRFRRSFRSVHRVRHQPKYLPEEIDINLNQIVL